MNFVVDNAVSGVKSIYVMVTKDHIIIGLDGKNKVFNSNEYGGVCFMLETYFNGDKLKYICDYIKDNLEHQGVKVVVPSKKNKPSKDDNQLTLF